jgi:putative hemolysin
MGITVTLPVQDTAEENCFGRTKTMEVRLAETAEDLHAAQTLRFEVFFQEMGARSANNACLAGRDVDRFDDLCDHLIVTDRTADDGRVHVIGTYRLLRHEVAMANGGFYTGQEFDIEPLLARVPKGTRFLEMGRSCVHPAYRNRPTIELLWRGILAVADRAGANVLFGCASFPGTDPDRLAEQFSFLHQHALAPPAWRVRPFDNVRVETNRLAPGSFDEKAAFMALPPLVKGYIRAGAWFSDGACIDYDFGTTDVMLILPRAQISPRYAARLGVGSWGRAPA